MRTFRRYYVPEAIVFITAVTNDRQPYLAHQNDIDLFWETARAVQAIHPFSLLAYAVLPDHLHCLLRPGNDEGNFSEVMHSIKRNYTLNYKKAHGMADSLHLWQDRFWDHVIRNGDDLQRHFDYIHWNPVKHDYVRDPELWPHSSYRHWLGLGYYEPGWGVTEPDHLRGCELE